MNYQDYIEIVPGKRSGKPCLKGTRITVYDVLSWLAQGMSQEEAQEDFPEVKLKHIQAFWLMPPVVSATCRASQPHEIITGSKPLPSNSKNT